MKAWSDAHGACDESLPCQRVDLPLSSALCDVVAAPGADAPVLDALIDAWNAGACETGLSCGFTPGDAVCEAGACVLKIDTSCQECPNDLDPQCTVFGQNALNPCYAEHCLKSAVAHPGYCEDSAECVAAGGSCSETLFFDPPCADGTRWNIADPKTKCPGGNVRNTCCLPWGEPCSFVAGSMTLSLDPFTCAEPTGEGPPWTCVHMPQQASCSLDAFVEQPFAGTYDADVRVTAAFDNLVTVEGTHHETGATFTCTGKASYDIFQVETWSCTACVGETCTGCAIEATGYGAL